MKSQYESGTASVTTLPWIASPFSVCRASLPQHWTSNHFSEAVSAPPSQALQTETTNLISTEPYFLVQHLQNLNHLARSSHPYSQYCDRHGINEHALCRHQHCMPHNQRLRLHYHGTSDPQMERHPAPKWRAYHPPSGAAWEWRPKTIPFVGRNALP